MHEQDQDGAGEHWYGAQEAASYLGMHRATLFRAIRDGLIVSDRTTPGGHVRFRLETLDAYRESLLHEAISSQGHVTAPVRIMANLARAVAAPTPDDDPRAVLNDTLHLLCSPHGGFDKACIGIHVPSATDPYALDFPASLGFPPHLRVVYRGLRPSAEFPVNVVLRTGMPQVCEDIYASPFPNATTIRALIDSKITSYAAFPIVAGSGVSKRAIGVLAVCGQKPRRFAQQEQVYLGGVADALSAYITRSALQGSLAQHDNATLLTAERAIDVASDLLEMALASSASSRAPEGSSPVASGVEAICNVFLERSDALATWVYGFSAHPSGNAACADDDTMLPLYQSYLRSLVLRARTSRSPQCEQWQNRVTAVALPVPTPRGQRGAVGAVWRGVRDEITAEETVLATLASACALVSEYSVSSRDD
jgi:excisionase family DNA binding protein